MNLASLTVSLLSESFKFFSELLPFSKLSDTSFLCFILQKSCLAVKVSSLLSIFTIIRHLFPQGHLRPGEDASVELTPWSSAGDISALLSFILLFIRNICISVITNIYIHKQYQVEYLLSFFFHFLILKSFPARKTGTYLDKLYA